MGITFRTRGRTMNLRFGSFNGCGQWFGCGLNDCRSLGGFRISFAYKERKIKANKGKAPQRQAGQSAAKGNQGKAPQRPIEAKANQGKAPQKANKGKAPQRPIEAKRRKG